MMSVLLSGILKHLQTQVKNVTCRRTCRNVPCRMYIHCYCKVMQRGVSEMKESPPGFYMNLHSNRITESICVAKHRSYE